MVKELTALELPKSIQAKHRLDAREAFLKILTTNVRLNDKRKEGGAEFLLKGIVWTKAWRTFS